MSYEFLNGLAGKIEQAAARALIQAAHKVQGDAKRLCPVRDGRLRGSITVRAAYESGGVVADIGTNVSYAPYVEFGTGQTGEASAKILPPDMKISYTKEPWTYKDPKTGKFIRTRGRPARPFLYPALKQNERYVREFVAKAVKSAVRGGG